MDTNQIDDMLKGMAEAEGKNTGMITDSLDKKIRNTFHNLDKISVGRNRRIKVAVCVLLCVFALITINPEKTLASVKTLFTYMDFGTKPQEHTVNEKYVNSIDKTITANDVNVNVTEAATDGNRIIIYYKISSDKFDFTNGFHFSEDNTQLNVKIDGKEVKGKFEGKEVSKLDKNSITIKHVLEYASLPDHFHVDFDFNKILGISGEWKYDFQLGSTK